ncbi:type VI secretion system tube protein TssD [Aquimarina muelleri]|nr:type VI secretion system tube protein TssD [Aquimarina muelleri]MCX2761560.1 type VI secretion system tube protein TssD [Aquimarina muelleri]
MGILAKLTIFGQVRELQNCTMLYQTLIDKKGKPAPMVLGGLIECTFITGYNEEVFLYFMQMPSVHNKKNEDFYYLSEGEVVFYFNSFDNPPLKRYKFNDAAIVEYREVFATNGETPMLTTITISPAIQDYGHPIIRRWNKSYIPPSKQQGYQALGEEEKEDFKFIATLSRKNDYNGEFGFDWIRNNYKNICENYQELKKEYEQINIEGIKYFVPWLSMFPNQENVFLNLHINSINGKQRNEDIIKLPAKNGIRFEPDQLKVKEANGHEIKVFCDKPLNDDVKIEFLDKNDNIVGKLIVVKNDKVYDLNLKIVKVVRSTSRDKDLKGINDALNTIKLNDFLNNNSLQQALIKTNIIQTECILELEGEISDDNDEPLYDGAVFVGKKESVSKMFRELYVTKYEKETVHKGVLLFVTTIRKNDTAGDGQLWDTTKRYCSIFYDGLYSVTTYVHEIAHVLGCEHSFDNEGEDFIKNHEDNILEEEKKIHDLIVEIEKHKQRITANKEQIIKMQKHPNNPIAVNNLKVAESNIIGHEKRILNKQKEIEQRKKNINQRQSLISVAPKIMENNKYVFPKKGSTLDNFMDYTNPRSIRNSFWKWQWKTIQSEIKTYYSK